MDMKEKFIRILIVAALFCGPIALALTAGEIAISHAGSTQQAGSFSPTGGGTYLLQSSISASQNTITLTSFTEPGSGIPYTMSYIGSDIIYGTIAPTSGNSEFISATGITQNTNGTATLTGVTRGESRTPGTGGCVASSTLAHAYPGQTQFILSDSPCFFSEYAVRRNAQTISGLWTFTTPPIGINPGGSPNASVTVNGLVQLATARQAASSTVNGSTGAPDVLQSAYATDTPNTASRTSVIPMTNLLGYLSWAWLDFTQALSWNGLQTFNGGFIDNASSTFTVAPNINGNPISPRFGGNGALGALSLGSGTTTINLNNATYLELDYTSISISSTGHLAFSNPNTNGTFIVIRSQGNVTLTCSPSPCIDVSGLGASGGAGGGTGAASGSTGSSGNPFWLFKTTGGAPGSSGGGTPAGGALPTAIAPLSPDATSTLMKYGGQFWVGAGGGGGGAGNASNNAIQGAGGAGGGSLLIEVGGSLNLTTTNAILASGFPGTRPTNTTFGGAGGGGSGGYIKIIYNTVTALTGTILAPGGIGAVGGSDSSVSCGAGGGNAWTVGGNGATGTNCTGGTGAIGATSTVQNINFF